MRFTKTLIGTGVAAAALGLLATASPAMADAGPLVPFPIASTVAPGTTGPVNFVFQNSGADTINFGSNTPGGIANPSSVVMTAPAGTTFPSQTTVPVLYSLDGGATAHPNSLKAQNCVLSNGGATLSCDLVGGANIVTYSKMLTYFTPQLNVPSSVAPGAVLTGGSGVIKMWNYMAVAPQVPSYLTATVPVTVLTQAAGPGQPIYNEDGSVDIPGTGTPGATITVKDASGVVIGTATVAADGTYDVKVPAAQAGTVTVSESDLPGTTWPVTIAADLLGTPIVNPFIAGGAAVAAIAGLGTVVLVRRRKAAVEA